MGIRKDLQKRLDEIYDTLTNENYHTLCMFIKESAFPFQYKKGSASLEKAIEQIESLIQNWSKRNE